MISMLKYIGKIAGWLDGLGLIMVILKIFYKELVKFIEMAVVAGNEILEAWRASGVDESIISAKKKELAAKIMVDAKREFSGSASRVSGALIEAIRGFIVTKIRMEKDDREELYRFDMMQKEHPRTLEDVKKEISGTYPQFFGD